MAGNGIMVICDQGETLVIYFSVSDVKGLYLEKYKLLFNLY